MYVTYTVFVSKTVYCAYIYIDVVGFGRYSAEAFAENFVVARVLLVTSTQ